MSIPSFSFERKLWKKGYKLVAGIDEVGRGCFAGPVVAGCVVFPKLLATSCKLPVIINDSKKLRARQRERASDWIKKNALSWGIGEAPATLINRIGMARAARAAFRRAISDANKRLQSKSKSKIDFLLIDAFFIPYVAGLPTRRRKDKNGRYRRKAKGKQLAIIDGDEKSVSIAAASIIAKVYRDTLMKKLGRNPRFSKYGWGRNKGYGTAEHQRAIVRYGISRYHRKGFIKTWRAKHAGLTGVRRDYAGRP